MLTVCLCVPLRHVHFTAWVEQYELERRDARKLQAESDAAIAAFEKKEQAEQARKEAAAGMPDEDGFITVTRATGLKPTQSATQKVCA